MFCKWLTSYMYALRVAIEFCGFGQESASEAIAMAAICHKNKQDLLLLPICYKMDKQ